MESRPEITVSGTVSPDPPADPIPPVTPTVAAVSPGPAKHDELPSGADEISAGNPATPDIANYGDIIGEKMLYVVKKGETLRSIGLKTGVNWRTIARENNLKSTKRLVPGQKLVIDGRRIVPKLVRSGIVINIPDQTLYLFRDNRPEKAFPVGLGRKKSKPDVTWQTPTGIFRIVAKHVNPEWHVPLSIQKEMEENNKPVMTLVPPGNGNPLGKYAIKTSIPGIMIHGTTAPDSVFRFSSHGCIRMLSGNIKELFSDISIKTRGEIIYQPVKLAVTNEGRIYLEVHKDIYGRYRNLGAEVKRIVKSINAESMVDWQKVEDSLKFKSGIIADITLENDLAQTANIASAENRQ